MDEGPRPTGPGEAMKAARRFRVITALDVKEGERLRFCVIPGNRIIVIRRLGNPLLISTKTGTVVELYPEKFFS